jgi:hypothetical protein
MLVMAVAATTVIVDSSHSILAVGADVGEFRALLADA